MSKRTTLGANSTPSTVVEADHDSQSRQRWHIAYPSIPFTQEALVPKRSDLFYVTVLVALLPPKSEVELERYYGGRTPFPALSF